MGNSLKYIYQHPLFSESDLEKIFSLHHLKELKKGDFFLKEKEISNSYLVLENGLMRSFVLDIDNNDITLEFFNENDAVIDASSLFQRIPSKENIQAITDCIVYEVYYDDFQELFHTIEGMREWGRMWFTFQLFQSRYQKIEMITETAKERYLKLLKEKPQIIQQAPLKQIATYLGITDTSLSRIRKEISEK
ncbi:Crp/Fnr family transcriptional regulator [Cloacibacterium caeni]|uniref:Crp/Fnr family transcriptional regulator n=1 Tax=Cloacibacterium caeni TaxID=2004710 RepID=UPI001BCC0AEE|nr:Crp/Fnr family transcriptional regulator [Cloacibacterium caeni]